MRLVIANSALRASLAIYHLIYIQRAHGIIVKYRCLLIQRYFFPGYEYAGKVDLN